MRKKEKQREKGMSRGVGRPKKQLFKKGEVVKKVFLAAGTGLAIGTIMAFPPLAIPFKVILETVEEREWEVNYRQIKRSLKKLEKEKIVALQEKDGELLVTFRKKGKELLLKYKLDELRIKKPKQWDKKWRIVIFDIPEKKKLARNVLREKLKELGFYRLQKSVFVYPYDCEREIELIKRVYEVGPFVRFIVADSIDNQARLVAKFSLP
jgi:CRISPR-associated endonuclease Cas2